MQLNDNLINRCFSELRQNRAKFSLYKRYYNGEHDILKDYAMQDSRSNMKVVCNFPRRFIDEEISYVLSNTVNYVSTEDNTDLINAIDLHFGSWEKVHDIELLKKALVYGKSYELNYVNGNGEFRSGVYTPMDILTLEDESPERNVVAAFHLFTKSRFDKVEYLDVYMGNRIVHYKLEKGLKKTGEDRHIFSTVPVTVCRANMEELSIIDDIKSLNDSYNNVLSDLVNEVSDFRNAFLTIVGAELEKDDVGKLKKEGIIQVPTGASVSFLIKNINDSFVQGLLTTLEKKIYQMASHIDHTEKMQPNTSSLALRSRLIALENKCSLQQAMVEMVIKARLKRFFEYLKIRTNVQYDYRSIKLKFTSNVPTDIVSIAQVITQLQNTISQETALSLLPFVENPKVELEKFQKEREMYEGIDLDRVETDE